MGPRPPVSAMTSAPFHFCVFGAAGGSWSFLWSPARCASSPPLGKTRVDTQALVVQACGHTRATMQTLDVHTRTHPSHRSAYKHRSCGRGIGFGGSIRFAIDYLAIDCVSDVCIYVGAYVRVRTAAHTYTDTRHSRVQFKRHSLPSPPLPVRLSVVSRTDSHRELHPHLNAGRQNRVEYDLPTVNVDSRHIFAGHASL